MWVVRGAAIAAVVAGVLAVTGIGVVSAGDTPVPDNGTVDDWPTYASDNRNTGHAGGPAPGANVTLAWVHSPSGSVTSSPAVVDGRVFVGRFSGDYRSTVSDLRRGGSRDQRGAVLAIEAATGERLWRTETRGSVWSSPAVANGTVYVGSLGGVVYALDATTGAVRWRFDAGYPVFSSPTVAGGRVYVGTRDYDAHELSHRSYPLYALDATDGSVVWRRPVEEGAFEAPAVANDTVYVGSQNGTMFALDAATGQRRWAFESAGRPSATDPTQRAGGFAAAPTVADGRVYAVSYGGRLYVLDAGTGTVRWQFDADEPMVASPSVTSDTVYVGDYGGDLSAIDAESGNVRWTVSARGSVTKSSPVVAGDRVYVSDRRIDGGTLYALRASNGSTVWSVQTDRWVLSSPAVAGGDLFAASLGTVFAMTNGNGSTPSDGELSVTAETGGGTPEPDSRSTTCQPECRTNSGSPSSTPATSNKPATTTRSESNSPSTTTRPLAPTTIVILFSSLPVLFAVVMVYRSWRES